MFDSALAILSRYYYDTAFVHEHLAALRDEFRAAAVAASDDSLEREVIRRLLERLPASHLALLSGQERDDLWWDLAGERHLMFGMQLIESNGRYFASMVLTGGPAYAAGIRDGDEIAAIDSVPPARSPHRDWREDDIYLPDERDPLRTACARAPVRRSRCGSSARPVVTPRQSASLPVFILPSMRPGPASASSPATAFGLATSAGGTSIGRAWSRDSGRRCRGRSRRARRWSSICGDVAGVEPQCGISCDCSRQARSNGSEDRSWR